jgi:hypothetical protein
VRLRDLLAKHKLACGTCGPAAALAIPKPLISHVAPC